LKYPLVVMYGMYIILNGCWMS